jgi:hypothetical protein
MPNAMGRPPRHRGHIRFRRQRPTISLQPNAETVRQTLTPREPDLVPLAVKTYAQNAYGNETRKDPRCGPDAWMAQPPAYRENANGDSDGADDDRQVPDPIQLMAQKLKVILELERIAAIHGPALECVRFGTRRAALTRRSWTRPAVDGRGRLRDCSRKTPSGKCGTEVVVGKIPTQDGQTRAISRLDEGIAAAL